LCAPCTPKKAGKEGGAGTGGKEGGAAPVLRGIVTEERDDQTDQVVISRLVLLLRANPGLLLGREVAERRNDGGDVEGMALFPESPALRLLVGLLQQLLTVVNLDVRLPRTELLDASSVREVTPDVGFSFRVEGSVNEEGKGLGFRVEGLVFRVESLGFRKRRGAL
jgi:hypothetical protein